MLFDFLAICLLACAAFLILVSWFMASPSRGPSVFGPLPIAIRGLGFLMGFGGLILLWWRSDPSMVVDVSIILLIILALVTTMAVFFRGLTAKTVRIISYSQCRLRLDDLIPPVLQSLGIALVRSKRGRITVYEACTDSGKLLVWNPITRQIDGRWKQTFNITDVAEESMQTALLIAHRMGNRIQNEGGVYEIVPPPSKSDNHESE